MIANSEEHYNSPGQAQASANTVISSMRKQAREETIALPQIYRQEMTKLYNSPACVEKAINLPLFQNLKPSLYCSWLQRLPTLRQTQEVIDFSGEWTQTAYGEGFLPVDTG